jgi:hypothetical protein
MTDVVRSTAVVPSRALARLRRSLATLSALAVGAASAAAAAGPRPLAAQDTAVTARPVAKRSTPAAREAGRKHAAKRARSSSAATSSKSPKSPKSPAKAAAPAGPKLDPWGRDSASVAALWPVASAPAPLAGSILPAKRIVAYYGNPLSKRMGVLGEYPVDDMLARLDREVARWNKADPAHPVQPALHLIAVVAQGDPGKSGKWRMRMDSTLIEQVASWAQRKNAILFLDVQVGTGNLREELPPLAKFLARPYVHLGIDPEFSMKDGTPPGRKIGTMDAGDVNYAASFLADIVTKNKLPPKVLVVHRFTRNMLKNAEQIRLDPRVQVVVNMDGWGPLTLKRDSYHDYVAEHPVQYTGFKLFYHNDERKQGSRIMTPEEVLRLWPRPLYIQYQ